MTRRFGLTGGFGLRSGLIAGLALIVCALAAPLASADPVAGATYNGTAADGASVEFTVSPDGTLVDSYKITNVKADTCEFTGEGELGEWEGGPVVNNTFHYNLYDAILFQGSFQGGGSASGTFRFFNHATPATQACDTGLVSWTASVGGSGGGGSGGGGGGGQGGSGAGPGSSGRAGSKHVFATRVTLRKLSSKRLGGTIKTTNRACRGSRTMLLWVKSRRVGRTRTKTNGTFWFPRSKAVRGHRVRASVLARNVKGGECGDASSAFVSG
jgi:hypothetical protein